MSRAGRPEKPRGLDAAPGRKPVRPLGASRTLLPSHRKLGSFCLPNHDSKSRRYIIISKTQAGEGSSTERLDSLPESLSQYLTRDGESRRTEA